MQSLDLNGTWLVRWTDFQRGRTEHANRDTIDRARYLEAQVPGEVHLDLVRADLLDDPADGVNVLKARWVEEQVWSYRREFEAPADALADGVRAWLHFDRLDLAAVVVLNGVEVGRHCNTFYPCRVEVTGKLRPGANVLTVPVEVTLQVPNPPLWWPVGHGPQTLHTLRATLRSGDTQIAKRDAAIGFRHVHIRQDPHPSSGRFFVLEVNGRPIFCKGGNFVPADLITQRIDRDRYDRLTDLALEQNFNFLRVWGGGLYESDDFFERCDRKGILVWQEFVFACSKYPVHDEQFHDDVRREARFNVHRLASHPSLVIWCGNNEMQWGAWGWNFDRGVVHPDMGLFHVTLPRVMAEEDPTRYYQPSSPYSPDFKFPNSDDSGDQHPWTIGFLDTDFRKYRDMICRFPNEGGILGPTSLPTVQRCLTPGPRGDAAVQGFAWQVHDNSVDSWAEPSPVDEMLRLWLGRDVRKMSLEQAVYWSGLVQGEGLREYVDNFRRRMFDSASAIFWMYNDTWPATRSWTTVDCDLRKTPAFHPVRRAMQPVSVVTAQVGDEAVVFGVNDTPEPVEAELSYGVMRLAGDHPVDKTLRVTLAANAATGLASFPMLQWTDPASSVAFALLRRGEDVIARHRLFLPLFKEVAWPAADVRVTVERGRATFRCESFAWGVCLDLDGELPLADNFFDVWPGVPHVIDWPHAQPPRVLFVGNTLRPG